MIKLTLGFFAPLLIIYFSLVNTDIFKSTYYGELKITSQMDGLSITINEKKVGTTKKGTTFKYEFESEDGSGDMGWHKIIFQKDINASHEYYLKTSCYFTDEEIKNKEIELIDLISPYYDYMKNKDFRTTYERVKLRTKRAVLLKQTALLKEKKLQHNSSFHFDIDDKYIYILSRANSSTYSQKKAESSDAEYLEVYDIDSLKLVEHIKLKETSDMFGFYNSLHVDNNYIYFGTYSTNGMYILKKELFDKILTRQKVRKQILKAKHDGRVNSIRTYKKYTFTLGEAGIVSVFKNNEYLYKIDTKRYRSKNYKKLDDKKLDSIFDLVVHKNIIYISNDIGGINMFELNDKKVKFIGGFVTFEYNEEKKNYNADDIPVMLIYKDRYLLFSREYGGLNMYDTKQKGMVYEKKTLYPKDIQYSELLKKDIDITKATNIYRMLVYKDNLIFTEVNDEIIIFNFKQDKIIHKFAGTSGDIFDIKVHKDKLISLSSDGKLYIWDLGKFIK